MPPRPALLNRTELNGAVLVERDTERSAIVELGSLTHSARRGRGTDSSLRPKQCCTVAWSIALQLYLSEKTVDHHMSAILRKLDAPSRRAVVSAGRARGILQDAAGG